ncbi:TPA: DUF418 domain-containing protein [Bacillus cereus]|nr:DUF418 domain-containing protein [Bacillus cereus]
MEFKIPTANSIDASYQKFLYMLVEARFYSIFAFLFGVGFYIFITRTITKGNKANSLFLRRMITLFIFGSLLRLFTTSEPITFYALGRIILLPFYKVKKEINLILSIIGLICLPFVVLDKFILIFPLILLGITAGQYRKFENILRNIKWIFIFTGVTFIFSLIAIYYQFNNVQLVPFEPVIINVDDPSVSSTNKFLGIGVKSGSLIAAWYIGILILCLQSSRIQKLFIPFKFCGRMALTNFISQFVILLIAGHTFNLFTNITLFQSLFLCLGVYLFQAIFSTIWLYYFKLGPMEWLWKVVIYLEISPFIKQKNIS